MPSILLQQAVDKGAEAAGLRYHLGMALLKNGNAKAAREHLEAALKSGTKFDGVEDARAALQGLSVAG